MDETFEQPIKSIPTEIKMPTIIISDNTREKEIINIVSEKNIWFYSIIIKFIIIFLSVLVIVILMRKIFIGKKYKEIPLKKL